MTQYNFQYLLDVNNSDSYERNKIIDKVDEAITDYKSPLVFHLVPILYSMTIASGMGVFIYSLCRV
jgi:hypothetical protein